jgi:hypothetical protein
MVGCPTRRALTRTAVVVAVSCHPDAGGSALPPGSSRMPVPVPESAPGLASAPAPESTHVLPLPESALVPAPSRALASAPASGDPPPAGEAHRLAVARLDADPRLLPHLTALRDHFGASGKGPFVVQNVDLVGGRTAFLVERADEGEPMEITIDRDQLLWSKPRPTAGILDPVKHLTLAPRPDGGVVIFGWVASLHMVAARMWNEDGFPFGDFELFAPSACDALSAAYGPGFGWIVVCASRAGTRAQRLREDATIGWGRDGATVGPTSASGPATIVFDSASTFLVLERVAAVGGDRLLAFRHDDNAQPMGSGPIDLGADFTAHTTSDAERVEARVVRDGVVRIERPRGAKGPIRAAEIQGAEVRYLP